MSLGVVYLSRPEAGEVAQIKCVCQGSKKARLGEVLEPDIIVNVTDINGNRIKKVSIHMTRDNY